MVKCTIRYEGGLHCELKHEDSAAIVSTDAPKDNHGRGESFSPTDLLCSSMAACMSTIMGIYAQQNDIDLTGMTIDVVKHMSANPRRVAKIETTATVPLPDNSPHCDALIQCALGSPVMMSLHPDVAVPITWIWNG